MTGPMFSALSIYSNLKSNVILEVEEWLNWYCRNQNWMPKIYICIDILQLVYMAKLTNIGMATFLFQKILAWQTFLFQKRLAWQPLFSNKYWHSHISFPTVNRISLSFVKASWNNSFEMALSMKPIVLDKGKFKSSHVFQYNPCNDVFQLNTVCICGYLLCITYHWYLVINSGTVRKCTPNKYQANWYK